MTPDPRSTEIAATLLATPGARVWIPVVGDSMRPTLAAGDRVEVEGGGFRPRPGDLILFRQADYLAVHRCLGRVRGAGEDGPWRARGDARPRLDPPVARDRILGRVVALGRADGVFEITGPAALAYARALSTHALVWGALSALAERAGPRVVALVATADRALARLADRVFFRALHRRRPEGPAGGAC